MKRAEEWWSGSFLQRGFAELYCGDGRQSSRTTPGKHRSSAWLSSLDSTTMESREQVLAAVSRETRRVRSVYAKRVESSGHINLYARCAMHEREEAIVRYF